MKVPQKSPSFLSSLAALAERLLAVRKSAGERPLPFALAEPPLPDGVREVPRAHDITALAAACLCLGLMALAGVALSPTLQVPGWLTLRIVGTAAMFALVGAGLLARWHWARPAALGMLCYGIITQLGLGWLQSDVLQAFVDAVTGQYGAEAVPAALNVSVEPLGRPLSLLVCAAMGWFAVRLAGAPVKAEFNACRRQRRASDLIRARND